MNKINSKHIVRIITQSKKKGKTDRQKNLEAKYFRACSSFISTADLIGGTNGGVT